MTYGKFPGTNKNFFPTPLIVATANNVSSSSIQSSYELMYTTSNKAAWLSDGIYPTIKARQSWRNFYNNNSTVRPTTPTDYTDAQYTWTWLTNLFEIDAVTVDGAKIYLEIFDHYGNGPPFWIRQGVAPYDGTWETNNGTMPKMYRYGSVGTTPPIADELLYFLQALRDKISAMGVASSVAGIILTEYAQNGLNLPADFSNAAWKAGGLYRDVQAAALFDTLNIYVFRTNPQGEDANSYDPSVVGYAHPDPKLMQSSCPSCDPNSAKGMMQSDRDVRPIIHFTEANGLNNFTVPPEGFMGLPVGSSQAATPERVFTYFSNDPDDGIIPCHGVGYNPTTTGTDAGGSWAGSTGRTNVANIVTSLVAAGSLPYIPAGYTAGGGGGEEPPAGSEIYFSLRQFSGETSTGSDAEAHGLVDSTNALELHLMTNATALDTAGNANFAFGVAEFSGPTQATICTRYNTASGTLDVGKHLRDTDAICMTTAGANSISGNGGGYKRAVSVDGSASTYNTVDAFGGAYLGCTAAIGGPDFYNQIVQQAFTTQDTAVNIDTSIQPNAIIVFGAGVAFDETGSANNTRTIGFACLSPAAAIKQYCYAENFQNGGAVSDLNSQFSSAYVGAAVNTSAAITMGLEVSAIGTDIGGGSYRTTITPKVGNANATYTVVLLQFDGCNVDIQRWDAPTSTGLKTHSTGGLSPQFALMLQCAATSIDTALEGVNAAGFAMAFLTPTQQYAVMERFNHSGATTSGQAKIVNYALKLDNYNNSGGLTAAHDSVDEDGWVLNYTRVSGAAWVGAALLVEPNPTPPDTDAPTNETVPYVSSYDDNEMHITGQINEDGTAFAAIYWPDADLSSLTSAQVIAGTGAVATDNAAATASTPYVLDFASLTGPEYQWASVARDDEGTPNVQASPTKGTRALTSPTGTQRAKVPDLTGKNITAQSLFYGLSQGDWVEADLITGNGYALSIDNDGYPIIDFGEDTPADDTFDWRTWDMTSHSWGATDTYDYDVDEVVKWETNELRYRNSGSLVPVGTAAEYVAWVDGDVDAPIAIGDPHYSGACVVGSNNKVTISQIVPGGVSGLYGRVYDKANRKLWEGDFTKL